MLSIAFTKAELLRMADGEFNEEKKDVKKMWLLTYFSSSPSQAENGELGTFCGQL